MLGVETCATRSATEVKTGNPEAVRKGSGKVHPFLRLHSRLVRCQRGGGGGAEDKATNVRGES